MKNLYLTLDTETCGSLGSPLVYDFGFAIHDNEGKIYERRSYVVREIFYGEWKLMRTAYYAEKIPMYRMGIKQGMWIAKSFWTIRKEVFELMKKYKIKAVLAYNAGFDCRALNSTLNFLSKFEEEQTFFSEKTIVWDTWGMACQTILLQKTFFKVAYSNEWVSECGNVRTSAEIAYRYLSKEHDFEEAHTALDDALIETAIFARCVATHKKMVREIQPMPWKIPQPPFREYVESVM